MPDSTVGGLPQAEKPISEITETTTLGNNDLLLVEQSGNARKIKGQNLKQYFNANVVSAEANAIEPTQDPTATYNSNTNKLILNLPSADYIVSITKTGSTDNVDHYRITSALGHTADFDVVNGTGSTADAVGAIALDGHQSNVNPVSDLNDFKTGIAAFNPYVETVPSNLPSTDCWWLVVSSGNQSSTCVQIAYSLNNDRRPMMRSKASGSWNAWSLLHDVHTPNPNLLDNPWFTVNQRASGTTYGETTTGKFLCDRWNLSNDFGGAASWAQSWHGITLNATAVSGTGDRFVQVTQKIPSNVIASILEKNVTFSYSYAGYSKTVTMPAAITGTVELGRIAIEDRGWIIFGVNSDGTGWLIIRAMVGHTVDIDRVKLELGTVSTLPLDARPEYSTELLKCQRYLYMFPTTYKSSGFAFPIMFGQAISATQVRFYVRNPSAFLKTPTVIEFGEATYRLYDADGGSASITSFQVYGIDPTYQTCMFFVNSSGLTANRIYTLQAIGTTDMGALMFSSEI